MMAFSINFKITTMKKIVLYILLFTGIYCLNRMIRQNRNNEDINSKGVVLKGSKKDTVVPVNVKRKVKREKREEFRAFLDSASNFVFIHYQSPKEIGKVNFKIRNAIG